MNHVRLAMSVGTCFLVMAGIARSERVLTPRLDATVRPCALSSEGLLVQRLLRGRYIVVVHDSSPTRYFRLTGPRVARTTTAGFTGIARWRLRLVPGTYRFSCSTRTHKRVRVR